MGNRGAYSGKEAGEKRLRVYESCKDGKQINKKLHLII
jgi:hypothetical protein